MKIIKTTFFTLILSTIFLTFFASAQGFPPVGFLPIIDPSSGCLMTGNIGFVVIVGLWGLVSIVVNTFGLRGVSSPDISSLSEGIINSSDGLCNLNSTNPKLQDLLSYITCII